VLGRARRFGFRCSGHFLLPVLYLLSGGGGYRAALARRRGDGRDAGRPGEWGTIRAALGVGENGRANSGAERRVKFSGPVLAHGAIRSSSFIQNGGWLPWTCVSSGCFRAPGGAARSSRPGGLFRSHAVPAEADSADRSGLGRGSCQTRSEGHKGRPWPERLATP